MENTKRRKVWPLLFFILALIFWLATVSHDTLGFVAPVGGEAIGFNLWTAFVWFLFLYSAWRLYKVHRPDK